MNAPKVLHYLMFADPADELPNWEFRKRLNPIWGTLT